MARATTQGGGGPWARVALLGSLSLALSACANGLPSGLAPDLAPRVVVADGPFAGGMSEGPEGMPRVLGDRPDDAPGFQLRAVYVVPADAPDARLDELGAVARSLRAAGAWTSVQTGGRQLRLDTFQGKPDVAFLRLKDRGVDVARAEIHLPVASGLAAAGLLNPMKTLLVYYDGPVDRRSPVIGTTTPGISLVHLRQGPFRAEAGPGGASGVEYVVMHEALHALGFVGPCSPHHQEGDHVTDGENDLMTAALPKGTVQLDINRDDYFGHGRPGCQDFGRSMFLEPLPENPEAPQGRPLAPDAGPEAVAISFSVPQGLPGDEGIESKLREALNQARRKVGLDDFRVDLAFNAAARQAAASGGEAEMVDAAYGAAAATGQGLPDSGITLLAGLNDNMDALAQGAASAYGPANVAQALTANRLGVGVVKRADGVGVVLLFGTPGPLMLGAKMGPSQLNTRTVALSLGNMLPGAMAYATLDEAFLDVPTLVDPDGHATVVASVPVGKRMRLRVVQAGVSEAEGQSATSGERRRRRAVNQLRLVGEVELRGDGPLNEAVRAVAPELTRNPEEMAGASEP